MPFLASEGCFWPPTASMTSEVKNNYAFVITQNICNKFIEVNFCVGCMVSRPNHLLQDSTTMSLINKKIQPLPTFSHVRSFDKISCCQTQTWNLLIMRLTNYPKTSQEAFFLINHTKMYCKTWLACHHVKIDYTAFADLFACVILSD